MVALKVKNLHKKYGDKLILKDINIDIHQPGVYLIVGPNGSGKTTLLEILVGLRQATTGTYQHHQAQIGFLTQENTLRPTCYVREEIKLIEDLYQLPKFNYQQFLDQYGLGDYLNHKTSKLSGGTQRRLLLALVLLADQPIIVLDEPVSGLDTFSRNEIWQMIAQASKDKIIIVSDHYLNQSSDYADHVFLLDEGHIIYSGTIDGIISSTGMTHTIKVRNNESADIVTILKQLNVHFIKKSAGTVDIFYLNLTDDLYEKLSSVLSDYKIVAISFEDSYFYLTGGGVQDDK